MSIVIQRRISSLLISLVVNIHALIWPLLSNPRQFIIPDLSQVMRKYFLKIFVTLTTGPMHPALGWLHAPLAILLLTFRHTKIEKYFRSIVSKIIWAQKVWWAGNSCTYQTFSLTIGWIYQNTKSSGCWQMRPTLVLAHNLELETNPGMSSCLRWRSISQAEAGVWWFTHKKREDEWWWDWG